MDITPIDGKITVFSTVSPSLDRDLYALPGELTPDEAAERIYTENEVYWADDIDNVEIVDLMVLHIKS